jgi:tRNA uridine 5-carboxymethylaminomethyl modification enzyme
VSFGRGLRFASTTKVPFGADPAALACYPLKSQPLAKEYDVIVIGGGHAGAEAAAAAARSGASTLLLTQSLALIGEASCNPSVGGTGKSTLIREIDALDGLMARCTDKAGINFKVLNASKGPAVQGPRAQIDRDLYLIYMAQALSQQANLTVHEDTCEDLEIEGESFLQEAHEASAALTNNLGGAAYSALNKPHSHASGVRTPRVAGVVTGKGVHVKAKKVVITTGTFLKAVLYCGLDKRPGGRTRRGANGEAEPSSVALANTLERLQFPLFRLTTGTPPRLDARTIDYSSLESQSSDDPPQPFSYLNQPEDLPQRDRFVKIHVTGTNKTTHELMETNRHLLPTFEGNGGKGQGPRSCPALEKKIIRFPDRESHQIWLEPEGLPENSHLVYPSGGNTAYPPEVQEKIFRSMKGLENVTLTRPAYAVEYQCSDPRALFPTLETRLVRGLYFAGQLNCTTGYSEAGAQGIIAGINAGLAAKAESDGKAGHKPFLVDRTESMIGVLLDDLTTLGAKEPYRSTTSRCEYRLSVRADNADMRLTEKGYKAGLVSEERYRQFEEKREAVRKGVEKLNSFVLPSIRWAELGFNVSSNDGKHRSAADILSLNDVEIPQVVQGMEKARPAATATLVSSTKIIDDGFNLTSLRRDVKEQITINVKYKGYLERQQKEIEEFRRLDGLMLPPALDYFSLGAIPKDEQEYLNAHRPATVHAASRIPRVRPSSLMLLLQIAKKHAREQAEASGSGAVPAEGQLEKAPSDSFSEGVLPADLAVGQPAQMSESELFTLAKKQVKALQTKGDDARAGWDNDAAGDDGGRR